MKQVIDTHGSPIRGLFRQKDGSLIVLDESLLNNSIKEHERVAEIRNLKDKVLQLENIIASILEKLK